MATGESKPEVTAGRHPKIAIYLQYDRLQRGTKFPGSIHKETFLFLVIQRSGYQATGQSQGRVPVTDDSREGSSGDGMPMKEIARFRRPKGKVWSGRILWKLPGSDDLRERSGAAGFYRKRFLFLMTYGNGHQATGEMKKRKTPPTFQESRHKTKSGTVLGECISPPLGTQSQREIMGPATLQQPG